MVKFPGKESVFLNLFQEENNDVHLLIKHQYLGHPNHVTYTCRCLCYIKVYPQSQVDTI